MFFVEVRTNQAYTETELETAIEMVHYAVLKMPEVSEANTTFNPATGYITTLVLLESKAPDSILDDLRAAARQKLIDSTRSDILDSISVSVVRYEGETLNRAE